MKYTVSLLAIASESNFPPKPWKTALMIQVIGFLFHFHPILDCSGAFGESVGRGEFCVSQIKDRVHTESKRLKEITNNLGKGNDFFCYKQKLD